MSAPDLIDAEEFYLASENLDGWCTSCREFTNNGVEPDAREYTCEVCGKKTVYGAEEALMMNMITFR